MTSCWQDIKRAAHFKALTIKLRRDLRELQAELKSARANGYIAGSAAMMAGVHTALDDGDLSLWISDRLLRQRTPRLPPFNLPPETEALVRREVGVLLKQCGIKPRGLEDIAL
jgi:hypothetical protein